MLTYNVCAPHILQCTPPLGHVSLALGYFVYQEKLINCINKTKPHNYTRQVGN